MLVDLSPSRFLPISQVLARIIEALHTATPFGLTRWADSSNWIMEHGGEEVDAYRYRESYMRGEHWPRYREAFLHGVQTADVLGVYPEDAWSIANFEKLGLDLADKALVHPRCNLLFGAYPEWTEQVLGGVWTLALIGNHMPAYVFWLQERFPRLRLVVLHTASHWLEVRAAMSLIEQTKPQLTLCGAGWFTSCVIGAAKQAGGVGISYGFAARDHLLGEFPPNTTGMPAAQYARQYFSQLWELVD